MVARVRTSPLARRKRMRAIGAGDLQPAGKLTGYAENIEMPPFAEVVFRKNLPKIAAIFGDLTYFVSVCGDGPVQRAAL